jgi:hypothetical protein
MTRGVVFEFEFGGFFLFFFLFFFCGRVAAREQRKSISISGKSDSLARTAGPHGRVNETFCEKTKTKRWRIQPVIPPPKRERAPMGIAVKISVFLGVGVARQSAIAMRSIFVCVFVRWGYLLLERANERARKREKEVGLE